MSEPKAVPVSYMDAPVLEQPAYSSPSRHAFGSPPDPDDYHLSSSSNVSPGRAAGTQKGAHAAAGQNTWELPADPYDAGLVNIDAGNGTLEQQPSRPHEGSRLSHGAERPQSVAITPSAGSSRPAYQPMQQQQRQRPSRGAAPAEEHSMSSTQQPQQQQQQSVLYSQAAHSAPGGSVVRIQLAAEQPQRSRSGSSGGGGGGPTPTGAQSARSRNMDPFSELVHPDMGKKLSIHDQDLWSRHHRDGDI